MYPQHMFSWRNKEDISIFQMKKAPYLLLCYSMYRHILCGLVCAVYPCLLIIVEPHMLAVNSAFI